MNTQRSIKTDYIVVQLAVRLVGAVRHGLKCASELPGDAGHELRTSGRDNFHAETTAQLLHTLSPHATRPHLPAQISQSLHGNATICCDEPFDLTVHCAAHIVFCRRDDKSLFP